MDNVVSFHWGSIEAQGAFYGASAGQAVSYVSSADIAAIAVAALLDPETHDGRTYDITGGEALTDVEVAGKVGARIGREVRFVDLPADQLAAGMQQQGTPGWLVEALIGLEGVKAQGWAAGVQPTVQQVLGRKPETFDAWLERTLPR